MHRRILTTARSLCAGCTLLGATTSLADADRPPWESPPPSAPIDARYVLAKASTLGTGAEYRYYKSERFGVRLESFEYRDERDRSVHGIPARWGINLRSYSVLLDWFPFEGRFHTTAGVYINRGDLSGTLDYGEQRFGGIDASAAQLNGFAQEAAQRLRQSGYFDYALRLDQLAAANDRSLHLDPQTVQLNNIALVSGRVRVPPYAPYLGFGWRNADDKRAGVSYSIDAGVMHLGRPRVEYTLSGQLVDEVRSRYGPAIDQWIADEERRAEDSLGNYRYYPVVSVGLAYRF